MVTKAEEKLTIDQLAQATGLTVRNIRAYQSRGLLPPPEIRGRTGYYGPEHEARLKLIGELQAEGFGLRAIKRLLDASDGAAGEILGFKHALLRPFGGEEPELVDEQELERHWGPLDPKLLERARRLGLIRPLGEGRYEVPSPTLLRAGQEVLALGVSPKTMFSAAAEISRHTEAIAQSFVRLFLEGVWKPFVAAGQPQEDWPRVREALDRLRPLASEAVVAGFELQMTQAVERAFGKQVAGD